MYNYQISNPCTSCRNLHTSSQAHIVDAMRFVCETHGSVKTEQAKFTTIYKAVRVAMQHAFVKMIFGGRVGIVNIQLKCSYSIVQTVVPNVGDIAPRRRF